MRKLTIGKQQGKYSTRHMHDSGLSVSPRLLVPVTYRVNGEHQRNEAPIDIVLVQWDVFEQPEDLALGNCRSGH